MPAVSIITITYNAERFLERTVESVINQQATDYEYIIVDGASSDGTRAIIDRYQAYITDWVSEPDQGLYDAMNKGLHRANGRYVWFMNAGDELHDNQTLTNLLATIRADEQENKPVDVYYSDALFVRDDGSRRSGSVVGLRSEITPHSLPQTLTWRDMQLGMKVCHQAFVARRSIAPDYLTNNLSADLDWEIRCLKAARNVKFLPFILCKYLMGGLSVQQHRQSLTDRFQVLVTHFGFLPTLLNHVRITWRAWRFSAS